MVLAKVVGTVVATQKESTLDGLTLLLVAACDSEGHVTGKPIVAADAVGAGVGEVVLYVAGSSARQTEVTNNKPVDATVMAIVDGVEIEGQPGFRK